MTSLVERLFRSTDTRRSGLGIARERIVTRVRRNTIARRQELAVLHGKLHALAPTSVFRRGYAVCSDKATGKLVTSPSQVEIGGSISVRVLLGSLDAEVKERYPIEQD